MSAGNGETTTSTTATAKPSGAAGSRIGIGTLIVAMVGSSAATYLAMSLQSGTLEAFDTVKTRAGSLTREINNGTMESLYSSKMSDEALETIKPSAKLIHVEIGNSPITDRGVAALSKIHSIRTLILTRSGISDAAIAMVAKLPILETLVLNQTEVTDAGMAALAGNKTLTELRLRRTPVGNAAIETIGQLAALRVLGMSYTRLDDAGVAKLEGLSEVEELRLAGTAITDAALASVGKMTKLQRLDLEHTKITDAGLAALSGLTDLRELWVADTGVSAAGMEQLRAIPGLKLVSVAGISGEADFVKAVQDDSRSLQTIYVSEGIVDEATMAKLETREPPLFVHAVGKALADAADE